jgi:hypothetical protein
MTLTYTAGAPSSEGTLLTVDRLLKDPKFLAQRIINKDVTFLTDEFFRADSTDSGAVVYAKASIADIFPARGDAQIVGPGAEIPAIDIATGEDDVAVVQKSGAGYWITDEARDRNKVSEVAKGNQMVRNVMLRQDANRCMAAFRGNVPEVNATAAWTTAKAFRTDIVRQVAAIKNRGLGYDPKVVLLNPEVYADLLLLDELQNYAPRENTGLNPLYSQSLAGYLGMQYVSNENVAEDEAIVLERKLTGTNVTEKPFTLKIAREETREREFVFATRRSVPVIDEPYSAVIIKGVR